MATCTALLKTMCLLSSVLALSACGSVSEEEASFAQTEEGVTTRFQCGLASCATFGTRTGPSALSCDRSNSGQTCALPPPGEVVWDVVTSSGPLVTSNTRLVENAVNSAFAEIKANNPGFTHRKSTVDPLTLLFVLHDGPNAVQQCGGDPDSSRIENFVCLFGQLGSFLTESLAGNYAIRQRTIVGFDMYDADIRPGLTAQQGTNFKVNMVRNGIVKALGMGGIEGTNDRCGTRTITAPGKFDSICRFTPGDLCRLRFYAQDATPSTFEERGGICGL